MTTAYVEERTQSPKGTWPAQGPDVYVAVQIVPDGEAPLRTLNYHNASLRGITIVRCGEGYSKNDGPRSMLYAARQEAAELASKINSK